MKARWLVLATLAALVVGMLAFGSAAWAAAFTVNSTNDAVDAAPGNGQCSAGTPTGGPCTLRAAVQETNALSGDDTITLANGAVYSLTIGGPEDDSAASGDLDVTGNLAITVAGNGEAIVDGAGMTPTRDNIFEIGLEIGSSVRADIRGLTIRNGQPPAFAIGGGILNSGTLTMTNTTVSDNTVGLGDGGGIYNGGTLNLRNSTVSANQSEGDGGGIQSTFGATMTLENSTVSGNSSASGVGGGISNDDQSELTLIDSRVTDNTADIRGGGISNGESDEATLTVTNSTISGNTATNSRGGGISNAFQSTATLTNSTVSGNSADLTGGGIDSSGTLTVTKSTISGNTVTGSGGGISSRGSAFLQNRAVTTLTNSTISGNTASDGAGGIENVVSDLSLTSVTLNDNSAPTGGNLQNDAESSATFKNTIVSNSRGSNNCANNGGTITSSGYNLDDDGSCGFTQPTDTRNQSPMLGPLANNGGPTLTHALLAGSPAIDKGKSFGESTDQRGLPRPRDLVGIANAADGSDIGAFELQASSTPPDTKAPKVIRTFPANGGEVGPAANISATFSEEMRPASVIYYAFQLFKKGSTNQIPAQVSYDSDTDTATLNPTNNLGRGVTYKAVVTTVAKDKAGNRLDQNSSAAGLQQKVWFFVIVN